MIKKKILERDSITLELTHRVFMNVSNKDPDNVSELIYQLANLLLKYGDLPVYSSGRYKLSFPMIFMEDKEDDIPTRIVVG